MQIGVIHFKKCNIFHRQVNRREKQLRTQFSHKRKQSYIIPAIQQYNVRRY